MTMCNDRVSAISNIPLPSNKRQLQSFIGMVNNFRIFVRNFATIAEPLYNLLRKNVRFQWTQSQTQAVNILKERLANAPIVKFPDYGLPFHLHTHASETGIGAVLLQEHNGVLHPVSYISKTLNNAQRAYPTTKKEALALVFALESFRHLVLDFQVTVYTDHKPLIGALRKPTKDECLKSWSILIQEYKINLVYLEGKRNIFADTLSRLPEPATADINKQLTDELLRQSLFCNTLNEYISEKIP